MKELIFLIVTLLALAWLIYYVIKNPVRGIGSSYHAIMNDPAIKRMVMEKGEEGVIRFSKAEPQKEFTVTDCISGEVKVYKNGEVVEVLREGKDD